MFCPQCGQRQLSNEVRFCSSCGFQLSVVSELLTTGGTMTLLAKDQKAKKKLSPRQKGIRQGAMLMLSTMLVVPLVAIIGVAILDLPGEISGVAAVTCFVGGLLRIIYALLLEDREAPPSPEEGMYLPTAAVPTYMNPPARISALPPQTSTPAQAYKPATRVDTGDLVKNPPSVTENTTRLLTKEPEDSTDR